MSEPKELDPLEPIDSEYRVQIVSGPRLIEIGYKSQDDLQAAIIAIGLIAQRDVGIPGLFDTLEAGMREESARRAAG